MQRATFEKYAACFLAFVLAVNETILAFFKGNFDALNEQLVGYLAGQHAIGLGNSDVRTFSATVRFFIPYCPKDRISAELKGVEKSTPRTPTTPLTLPVLIALACFVAVRCGLAQACGMI